MVLLLLPLLLLLPVRPLEGGGNGGAAAALRGAMVVFDDLAISRGDGCGGSHLFTNNSPTNKIEFDSRVVVSLLFLP